MTISGALPSDPINTTTPPFGVSTMARVTTFALGGSSRTGLLLAAGLAAVTGLLVFASLRSNSSDDAVRNISGGSDTTVVTAKVDIPARTEIKPDMLEISRVPEKALLAGAFASRDLVTGRVARIPIYKGEQVIQEKVASFESNKADLGLSFVVPKGQRAMAVKVDKVVGAGGLIRPGDRVDIVGVMDVKYEDIGTERNITLTRSFLIAQDIEVLAVEQKLLNQIGQGRTSTNSQKDGALIDQPGAQPEGVVVTLAISPQQTQQVLLAEERGKIRLAVRAPGDKEIVDTGDTAPLGLLDADIQKAITEALRTAKR